MHQIGYHKIPDDEEKITIEIPLNIMNDIISYHKEQIPSNSNFLEFFNHKINDNSILIIGKKSIDRFIFDFVTNIKYIINNYLLFEETYRVCSKQLLQNGWPQDRVIYRLDHYPHGEYFIRGLYVPNYNRDWGCESLFAYIKKGDRISKFSNETELTNFDESLIIFIEKDDIEYLQLKPYEYVKVWFFHGNI